MLGPSARAVVDRVAALRVERLDALEFRLRTLDAIRKVVSFDAFVWLITDPETAVGAAPFADVPFVLELPALIRLKYLTAANRWTELAARSVSVASLDRDTRRQPALSTAWREMLRRYDITDIASAVFADRWGCWGFLDLWRAGKTFGDAELALIAELAAPITSALRECQLRTFVTPPRAAERHLGPAVVLLDDALAVIARTPAAEGWLRTLLRADERAQPIPAAAYNVAAQLLAIEAGVDLRPASARVHLADGLWLTLRAARLAPVDTGAGIVVTIEETSPTDRLAVYARAGTLTPRESELLRVLAEGVDTHEVAARLVVSENTVQDHLKSIFVKTGTNSRRALLSRALGARGEAH